MDDGAPGSSGLLGSLRGFADGLLGSVHDRVELLSIELREEKHRLVQTFLWAGAIVFAVALAVLFASFAVVAAVWDTAARLPVVGGLAAGHTLVAAGLIIGFRRFLARQPAPFAATIDELRADRACMRRQN